MPAVLNDIEQRVLGVLLEKSLAHPGSYPLTLNAVLLGANQKQNRDPVVEYAESDVSRALHSLQLKGLVKQAAPAMGARANRFQHHVVEALHWDQREQAVMAELLLRGRQTPGELRTHASRMTPLQDMDSVSAILKGLAAVDPPFVVELPREPGRSANRWQHRLSDDQIVAESAPAETRGNPGDIEGSTGLEQRVALLEEKVAELVRRLHGVVPVPGSDLGYTRDQAE